MYAVDPSLDLTFLIGRKLTQLCLGEFDVQLHFDGHVTIWVGSRMTIHIGGRKTQMRADDLAKTRDLAALVGQIVTSARAQDTSTVSLIFDDGSVLSLIDDEEYYESYTIVSADRYIVV